MAFPQITMLSGNKAILIEVSHEVFQPLLSNIVDVSKSSDTNQHTFISIRVSLPFPFFPVVVLLCIVLQRLEKTKKEQITFFFSISLIFSSFCSIYACKNFARQSFWQPHFMCLVD